MPCVQMAGKPAGYSRAVRPHVLVTRIPFCQPGVEGLEKENKISQDTRIGKINTDLYIIHNKK